ncbi:MAG: hypothetical protein ABIG95_04355 [Candidatus Woesearchaeota archaeon]
MQDLRMPRRNVLGLLAMFGVGAALDPLATIRSLIGVPSAPTHGLAAVQSNPWKLTPSGLAVVQSAAPSLTQIVTASQSGAPCPLSADQLTSLVQDTNQYAVYQVITVPEGRNILPVYAMEGFQANTNKIVCQLFPGAHIVGADSFPNSPYLLTRFLNLLNPNSPLIAGMVERKYLSQVKDKATIEQLKQQQRILGLNYTPNEPKLADGANLTDVILWQALYGSNRVMMFGEGHYIYSQSEIRIENNADDTYFITVLQEAKKRGIRFHLCLELPVNFDNDQDNGIDLFSLLKDVYIAAKKNDIPVHFIDAPTGTYNGNESTFWPERERQMDQNMGKLLAQFPGENFWVWIGDFHANRKNEFEKVWWYGFDYQTETYATQTPLGYYIAQQLPSGQKVWSVILGTQMPEVLSCCVYGVDAVSIQ